MISQLFSHSSQAGLMLVFKGQVYVQDKEEKEVVQASLS